MEKERTKLSFLWFNLFYCMTSGALAFLCFDMIKIQMEYAAMLATYVYLSDVNRNTVEDYLKYKIDLLESKMNQKLILKQDADI